jgi:hypothetical protein
VGNSLDKKRSINVEVVKFLWGEVNFSQLRKLALMWYSIDNTPKEFEVKL